LNIELTQQLQTVLNKFAYRDDISKSGWEFTLIDNHIIRFQPYGLLDRYTYEILSEKLEELLSYYFEKAEFLIFLFDFAKFKKATSDVRSKIIEGRIFNNERVSFVFYGMNYFVSTISKMINNRLENKRLFVVKNEEEAIERAKKLLENYNVQKIKDIQEQNNYFLSEKIIEIAGKSYKKLSRPAWTYTDPGSDYFYKIELIDDNILVSQPSGYILYQNSVMANVLFDKVINSELGQNKKYYRIQDYSSVVGSENKARRDFTDYIISGIDSINLMVFYGLNTTMKTVVRLGKLMHPAFKKIRIANTFEESLELVIADKYKTAKRSKKQISEKQTESIYFVDKKELEGLKENRNKLEKENDRLADILFEKISQIAFGDQPEISSIEINENHLFYNLFNAVQLLQEDFSELRNDRDFTQSQLQKRLTEHTKEIKELKEQTSLKLKSKDNFIRSRVNELNSSLEAIINTIQFLRKEGNLANQKKLFEIVKMSSIILQDGIGELKSTLSDDYPRIPLSDSMFNYRTNIAQLIEAERMGIYNRNVKVENKTDEDLPTFLIGDKRKFNQLFTIFLENAIKFTSFGFIKVDTQVVESFGGYVNFKVTVEDSGIGINENIQQNLFKEEIDENKSGNDINGFGLQIAKDLAKVLNAKIGFESEVGAGSKFWFELRFNIGYHDKRAQMQDVREQRKSMFKNLPFDGDNALVICDGDQNIILLEQMLQRKGIQSHIKLNYELFEDIEGAFDFVFVSLQLIGGKELSSFKLLKETLDAKNNSKKPIYIGCVDSYLDSIMEEYRKIGVDHFIQKNLNITEFDQLFGNLK